MTFLDAAEAILKKHGQPLSPTTIARLALDEGLLETAGKTPHATMSAQINTDIKRRGRQSKFVKVSRGLFGLSEWKKSDRLSKDDAQQQAGTRYWMITTSPDNFELDRKKLGFRVQGLRHRHRKMVQKFRPGDKVVYYINRISRFGAIARITSGYFKGTDRLWTDEDELWPSRAHSEPELVLDAETMLDAIRIKDNLSFVQKYSTRKWGIAFQGSIRELSEEDFKLIESEMKKLPHSQFEHTQPPGPPPPPPHIAETATEDLIMRLPLRAKSLHDRLGEMLEAVGSLMGYNATTRQKITPDHVYELDVAWLKNKNPQVAIEVQISGNIDSALKRLSEAKRFNYRKLILVIKEEQMRHLNALVKMDEIRHWLDAWSISSVYDLYDAATKFFRLYDKIEESRWKDVAELDLV